MNRKKDNIKGQRNRNGIHLKPCIRSQIRNFGRSTFRDLNIFEKCGEYLHSGIDKID